MSRLEEKHFEEARMKGAKYASDKVEGFIDVVRNAFKDESTGEFKYDEAKLKLLVGREMAMAYSLAYLQASQSLSKPAHKQGKSLYIP